MNLRTAPSTSSEVVTKLPIGTEVRVIEVTNKDLELNNFKSKWVKVRVVSANNLSEAIGYIWGGLLAYDKHESSQDKEVYFLFGMSKVDKGSYSDKIIFQIRAVKGNKELSKIEFEGIGSFQTSVNFLVSAHKGLNNVTNIITVDFSEDFCGGANGLVYVFWDKSNLHYVKTLSSGFDAPYFHNEEFYFPGDEKGKSGRIIFHTESGEHKFEGDSDIEYDFQETIEYIWTGTELEQVSE